MKSKPCAFCKTEHVGPYKYCTNECYALAENDRARARRERARAAVLVYDELERLSKLPIKECG